jgi:hypothetical protein
MILKAIVDDHEYSLNVPDSMLTEAEGFFAKLDADMDQGWQMSREWVSNPSQVERCQIVANKLLTALEKENEKLGMLMAGYILSRMPGVESVEMDTHGEIQNTQFRAVERPNAAAAPDQEADPAGEQVFKPSASPMGMNKLQAMEQAGNDVTKVFRVGKGYRFSVYDHGSGQWQDSPLLANESDAERLRQEAFKARFESLQQARH